MSASTGSRYGVARKPVPRWVPASRISSTRRAGGRARAVRRGPDRTPARARGWPACPASSVPSASTYSVRHASRARRRELVEALGLAVVPEQPTDRGQRARRSGGGTQSRRDPGRPSRRLAATRRARATRPSGSRVSHRYASWGAGSGRAVTRARVRYVAALRARRTRPIAPSPARARRARRRRRRSRVQRPRHHDDGVAPSGRALECRPAYCRASAAAGERIGREVRAPAVGALLGGEVAQPLQREARRRRRGTRRSGGRPASRRSTPPARVGGSRSGCRTRCRGSSSRRSRGSG